MTQIRWGGVGVGRRTSPTSPSALRVGREEYREPDERQEDPVGGSEREGERGGDGSDRRQVSQEARRELEGVLYALVAVYESSEPTERSAALLGGASARDRIAFIGHIQASTQTPIRRLEASRSRGEE